jgi:hypothetical protein
MLLVRVSIFPYPPAQKGFASSTCLPRPIAGFAPLGLPVGVGVVDKREGDGLLLPNPGKQQIELLKICP